MLCTKTFVTNPIHRVTVPRDFDVIQRTHHYLVHYEHKRNQGYLLQVSCAEESRYGREKPSVCQLTPRTLVLYGF